MPFKDISSLSYTLEGRFIPYPMPLKRGLFFNLRPLRTFILYLKTFVLSPVPFKAVYSSSYTLKGHIYFILQPLRTFILYPAPLKDIYSVSYTSKEVYFLFCAP